MRSRPTCGNTAHKGARSARAQRADNGGRLRRTSKQPPPQRAGGPLVVADPLCRQGMQVPQMFARTSTHVSPLLLYVKPALKPSTRGKLLSPAGGGNARTQDAVGAPQSALHCHGSATGMAPARLAAFAAASHGQLCCACRSAAAASDSAALPLLHRYDSS